MAFTSQIYPGELIIDDDNADIVCPPQNVWINGELKTRGLIPRDFDKVPYGSQPFAGAFPTELEIPESEWPDRIKELEETKSRVSDFLDQAALTVLDQNGTNYCWINAPVHCVEIMRVVQGEPLVRLSPASCGGPIKNYRNVGGWGTEGLAYIVEHGIVPQAQWPANAIDRKYDTPETRELRKRYMVYEWYDLKPRNMKQLISCLLHRIPVAVGLNWWGHEVTYIDPVVVSAGQYGARIDNSWGLQWGERGRGILSGSKVLPDDAVAPRVVTPSLPT